MTNGFRQSDILGRLNSIDLIKFDWFQLFYLKCSHIEKVLNKF
jgi:hypothetical protein